MKCFPFITKLIGLAFLPFALFGGPVTLLCIGEGGHLAIETASGSSCEAGTAHADPEGHEHDEEPHPSHFGHCHNHEESCGDCVDFELELDDFNSLKAGASLDFLLCDLPLPLTPTLVPRLWRFPCPGIESRGPPWASLAFHESYATIRLLI